ncbi:MAG: hypothetical protein GY753_02835 [Gammaproteobacteria bacterium]|nr:hypothetical protein [Gammaproteobacteria bacterium]
MKSIFLGVLVLMLGLTGCARDGADVEHGLGDFVEVLKAEGVDGKLVMRGPINDGMVYVAEYVISKYTSTRIISIFKCKDEKSAESNLQDALKNDKLSGQARNGNYLMAATFYPEEEQAVAKIKELFLAHKFE